MIKMVKGAFLMLFAAMALCGFAYTGKAQILVNFSGGGGTPVTFTLTRAVTYTITTTTASGGDIFVFKGVGDDFTNGFTASGNIDFSINGGALQNLTEILSGFGGNLSTNDVFLMGASFPGLSIGDSVTLTAGSLTTSANDAAVPASGSYQSYVGNSSGIQISANGVSAVPEPSTYGLLGMAAAALSMGLFRRRIL